MAVRVGNVLTALSCGWRAVGNRANGLHDGSFDAFSVCDKKQYYIGLIPFLFLSRLSASFIFTSFSFLTIIYLAVLINKWILAGIDWHSKVIWDSGSLMNSLCPIFTLNEDSQIPSYHELHELSSALLGEAWKDFGSQIKVEFVCNLH